MKKIISKKYILGIITGIILTSVVGVYAIELCNARDIEYNASDSNWQVDSVEDALNELYKRTIKICSGFSCIVDNDYDGKITFGDEISIGNEEFYVISNDGESIHMLAKYNLEVGNVENSDYTADEETNIQSSRAIGFNNKDIKTYVTIAFSSDNQKGEHYCSYEGSIVERYVNKYVSILKEKYNVDALGRLLSKEEVEEIAGETLKNETNLSENEKIPTWLYSTSYWTQSSGSTIRVWAISSTGSTFFSDYTYKYVFGVRPVITISASLF